MKINSIQKGKITNIVDYGLFIVLECDVTALLHISELKKHNKICANFDVGDDIDVKILKRKKFIYQGKSFLFYAGEFIHLKKEMSDKLDEYLSFEIVN